MQMNYASSGVGSALHVYGELFNVIAGMKLTHVPYPGSAQSLTDLAGWPDLGDVLSRPRRCCRTSNRAR